MDQLRSASFLSHLSCLAPTSHQQVISYLQSLHARAYSPNTLYAVAGVIKKFLRQLAFSAPHAPVRRSHANRIARPRLIHHGGTRRRAGPFNHQ